MKDPQFLQGTKFGFPIAWWARCILVFDFDFRLLGAAIGSSMLFKRNFL